MSDLFEQTVRESRLLMRVQITGTMDVGINGCVSNHSMFVMAVCPECEARISGGVERIVDHVKKHAEYAAMQRIVARSTRRRTGADQRKFSRSASKAQRRTR